NNLKPVGTGPYRFVEFKPGDLLKGEINPNYHVPGRPFFDAVEVKGGGDAASAARAVLQTGEYDYASEAGGVEDDVLQRLEGGGRRPRGRDGGGGGPGAAGRGARSPPVPPTRRARRPGGAGERRGERPGPPSPPPPAVKGALAVLVDRTAIQEQILGRLGQATGNWLNNPERFRSRTIRWEFNIDKANQLLDNGGWKRGADGVRARDGKRLKMLFATAI